MRKIWEFVYDLVWKAEAWLWKIRPDKVDDDCDCDCCNYDDYCCDDEYDNELEWDEE